MTLRLSVIDTETTGFEDDARLVEIASVGISIGDFAKEYLHPTMTLTNPGIPIPPVASAVHHLTDRDVHAAIPNAAAIAMHAGADIYIAHNAAFDRKFLPYDAKWICTYKVAYDVWPDAPAYGNQVLRYWLGLRLPYWLIHFPDLAPHRALFDVAVTSEIFLELLKTKTLEEMIEITERPLLLRTVSFGKHYGVEWSRVPHDYLRWLLKQDFDEDVLYTARHYLRGGN